MSLKNITQGIILIIWVYKFYRGLRIFLKNGFIDGSNSSPSTFIFFVAGAMVLIVGFIVGLFWLLSDEGGGKIIVFHTKKEKSDNKLIDLTSEMINLEKQGDTDLANKVHDELLQEIKKEEKF